MNLSFQIDLAKNYKSPSQRVRVLTENWVSRNIYCPNCGYIDINKYKNNKPVSDFFCFNCKEVYELKSKHGKFGSKIVNGAYATMIERLNDSNNPNLFLLNYDLQKLMVLNLFVIPKHFFVPDIIEKREALAQNARRAGWVGCNIILKGIPQIGKIFLIKNRQVEPKDRVVAEWRKTLFLREEKKISAKGWLLDVIKCIEELGNKEFTLDEVYAFENILSNKHPDNKHIKDKIRQQLQILRDKGYLEFIERGHYRLT
jgi:type II restriction enzyme